MKIRLALAGTAALLVAAVIGWFMAGRPRAEEPVMPAVEPQAADEELVSAADLSAPGDPGAEAVRRSPVAEEPPGGLSATRGANVLRVLLEGITEQDARAATVTVTGVDEREQWPEEIRDSWLCQGLTSEFDLDPFLARVERHEQLRLGELEVEVDPPHHLSARARVPLSRGVELTNGISVHEVRVRLVRPEFWPEFTLAVRDAQTRAHLEDVELRFASGGASMWGWNPPSTLLGGGLRSPIALMGGREADEPEVTVACLALSPAAGESPRLVEVRSYSRGRELGHRFRPERGVGLSARAPGYAWGSIELDVSKGAERELLLKPGTTLGVRLSNVQLESYASIDTVAMLCVYRIKEDGGNQYVRFERLGETLMAEGLRLDSLGPGGYRVSVELVGGAWATRPVLASREVSLAAGETRELMLALKGPPAPPERATLGGVVTFPDFGGMDEVRLKLYEAAKHDLVGAQARYQRTADIELSLADLERVGGAPPTWAFHLEGLPIGLYQIELWPFLKSWMIELPAGGREDVELVIPELAEVLVETVDARTGERIPLDGLYYRHQEELPRRVHIGRASADPEEPGRFRFWSAPGAALVYLNVIPSGMEYGKRSLNLELVSGVQSVRFELEPVFAFRIEFRDGGAALDRFDELWGEAYGVVRDHLRAVDHEGRLTNISGAGVNRDVLLVEVSAPGLYEAGFEDLGADRFLPIPPQRVDVRAGETAEVIVELRRE